MADVKVLYIGKKIVNPQSGVEHVNKRNQLLLEKVGSVDYVPFVRSKFSKFVLSANNKLLDDIKEKLDTNLYKYVFVQQSTLGRVCSFIKRKYPDIIVVVFFHNIELQYAKEYIKTNGIKALPFYLTVKYWEKLACRYSDKCITLNARDSKLLNKIYKRNSTLELPTSFDDLFDLKRAQKIESNILDKTETSIDFLFVGVSFFANVQAVQWFIDNVMPNVQGHFHVVGKGMDKIQFNNITNNVHVYGFVDDLSEFYYRARLIVSPIHVGGGMKTKTAEALMFGKTILGTSEAFEGYILDKRCCILCNSKEDFILAINRLKDDDLRINEYSRELFNTYYSNQSMADKLASLFR